jgi:response regulator RpfG family c-di-GMP phosphodiesterase
MDENSINWEQKTKELESIIEDLSTRYAESFYQTIRVLATLATTNEQYYDGSHSRFVSQKSSDVAAKLGMDDTDIYEIQIAGLLHDIGLCGFKDSLLQKFPGEMRGGEFRQYSTHPEIGVQILSQHSGFDTITNIILQHHEKIDGSGFPKHLMGKEINPGAAVIAVVDTFHNSCYRRAKDRSSSVNPNLAAINTTSYMELTNSRFANAMNYLNSKKGILFDTKVVDVFTELIESDRKLLGQKVTLRLPIGKLESGMIFAEDYFSSYGMLIAARGEVITHDSKKALMRFAESGEIPLKILILK